MVVDSGCPVENAGKRRINSYLEAYGIDAKTLKRHSCHQVFKFGSTRYVSDEIVELLISIKDKTGKVVTFIVSTYSLNADTPFLLAKKTMKEWKAKINVGEDEFEVTTKEKGTSVVRVFEMKGGSHSTVDLQMESEDEEVVFFVDKNWDHVTSYKGVKKVHEVHGHKSVSNMLHAYKLANLLTPDIRKIVSRVIDDCKICQKFKESVPWPKLTLQKATDFNQIVTLDLKEMHGKYILWIVCSFSRFFQGVLNNKKKQRLL